MKGLQACHIDILFVICFRGVINHFYVKVRSYYTLLLTLFPFAAQNLNILIKKSIRNSSSSNIIDTDMPKYKDRAPPTAETIEPVIY